MIVQVTFEVEVEPDDVIALAPAAWQEYKRWHGEDDKEAFARDYMADYGYEHIAELAIHNGNFSDNWNDVEVL